MNRKIYVVFIIVFLLAGCGGKAPIPISPTVTNTAVSNTKAPIPISPTVTNTAVSNTNNTVSSGGIQLSVISAIKQDTYDMGGQAFTPNSPLDECLIVEASINGGDSKVVQGWAVSITDENGRKSESNITSVKTYTVSKDTTIMWLFVVARTSHSLTLHLPDEQAVELISLIK